MRWDVFCRVIDNFGDIGVCWRLAAELGRRGHAVTLWLDDRRALAWMAPQGAPGVTVRAWDGPAATDGVLPGDVVLEAFGCDPPPSWVAAMARARPWPPVWINLEYLSAEDYVERSHGLRSPVLHGTGAGLDKWFFYPGFTPRTGGLLREPGLIERLGAAPRREAVDPRAQVASVFCYPTPSLARLAQDWPGRLRLAGGSGAGLDLPRSEQLAWLDQAGYDQLLWDSDLNIVRGEDSLVRACWAARPFLWHLYPQHDGAHGAKLEAFLDRFLQGADARLGNDLRALWRAWNGLAEWPSRWPDRQAWIEACLHWRDTLLAQDDLVTQLLSFVRARVDERGAGKKR